jgi:hypothetical protein
MNSSREAALTSIVAEMKTHGITLTDVATALGGPETTEPRNIGDAARRVFAWLGGILIFAGVGVYISMFWDEMNSATRVLITLGTGMVVYAMSVMALHTNKHPKAVLPGLLIGIVMQTTGWFVLIHEYFNSGSDARYAVLTVMGIMAVQQGAVFSKYRLTLLLFALLFFAYAFTGTLFDLMDMSDKLICTVLGLSMMAIAHKLNDTEHGRLSPLGYGLGGILFYVGLFQLVKHSPGELLFLGVAVANLVYVSTYVRSTTLLVVSTGAILSYIGYFTSEHFVDTVGWPIALILLGVAFIGVSGAAFKIRKKIR